MTDHRRLRNQQDLIDQIVRNPYLYEVLEAMPELGLPNCFIAAGCIVQTVWNLCHGREPAKDIKDIDLIYFDPDLAESSERAHQQRLRQRFSGIPVAIDVKNEARVHLWYPRAFGYTICPYSSVEQAISTFPTTATAIGVRKEEGAYRICAPFGLDDLFGLIVRPNKSQITSQIYEAKVSRWKSVWPRLTIIPWDVEGESPRDAS